LLCELNVGPSASQQGRQAPQLIRLLFTVHIVTRCAADANSTHQGALVGIVGQGRSEHEPLITSSSNTRSTFFGGCRGCTRKPTSIWTFVELPFLSGFTLKWHNRNCSYRQIDGSFTQNRRNLNPKNCCNFLQVWHRTVLICGNAIPPMIVI